VTLRGSASRRVADVTISYRAAVQSDGAPPSAKSCQPTGGSSYFLDREAYCERVATFFEEHL
jgi:hypothetical protein